MIGQTISHYRILEKLGEGGMGVVYKAHDTKLDRPVALKFLPSELTRDPEAKERFILEAKAASALQHNNICTVHDVDESSEGQFFIVMDFYEGETLEDRIKRGALDVDEAVAIAVQVATGLQRAHGRGIVHRDVKPANIVITHDKVAKILDFGLAKLAGGRKLTKVSSTVGTVAYMSPEQARGEEVDQRTDIWSLGVVLYEMLAGGLPFPGDYDQAIIYRILNEEAGLITSLRSNVPTELEQIVKKAMRKTCSDRYQHVDDILVDLISFREGGESHTQGERPSTTKESPSIAVLPFKDMSPQRDQDYLCEGFAEEMINALAQVEGLKVAARTSSFSFKGKDEDIRDIGRRLNVGSILEGGVQKSGNRLRLTAQLISVSDGYHLWSERFDRNIKDVFAVQDEISMAVVQKLKVELFEGEKERVTKRHTRDEKAYELYLKGRYHWNRRSPLDMISAVDCFQRAIDKDPQYALAYVGIADVINMLAQFGFIEPQEAYLKSRALLQKTQEIDDSLSELYASLALITYCHDWDLPAAERQASRSIELNPQNLFAHGWRAEILGSQGRLAEALEEAKRGVELEPLSAMAHFFYGFMLGVVGRKEEGREQLQRTLAMEPDNPMFLSWLGLVYLEKPAIPEKAIEYLQKAAGLHVTLAYGILGMAQAMAGRREDALKCLEKLERIEKERFLPLPLKLLLYFRPGLRHFRSFKKKYCPCYLKAIIYWALNMQEEALAEFEKSSQARDYILPALFIVMENYDLPWTGDIISSPRFQALRAKIKMA